MLTASQALKKLSSAGITDSEQVLRRWLRQGKIPNARIQTKKKVGKFLMTI